MIKTLIIVCLIVLFGIYVFKTKNENKNLNDNKLLAIYNKMAYQSLSNQLQCKCKDPNCELCEKCFCLKMVKIMDFYIEKGYLPLDEELEGKLIDEY